MNENRIFIAAITLVLAVITVLYGSEYTRDATKSNQPPIKLTTESTSITSTTSTATMPTATTLIQPAPTSTSPSTLSTTTATSETTTSSTNTQINPYFARFTGRGYHQAYIRIHYFCPSCLPAVAALLSEEPGVKSKSIGYQQKISYVIYDPRTVSLERVMDLSSSSAGADFLNDTEI
jgi:hypothetical protein